MYLFVITMKTKILQIRLKESDTKIVKELREKHSINISSFVRKCLNKQYEKLK